MNKTRFGLMAVTAAILALFVGRVLSQEGEKKKDQPPGMPGAGQMSPDEMAKMQKWMATTQPSAHHKHLEHFVGQWDTTMKIWMSGPDGPPMESEGTSTVMWVLGGRYLQEEMKGEIMGMPYEGLGLTGYDNYKNMYMSSWASNADTQFLTMTGARHPKTGIFTFYGAMDEAGIDVHGRTVKYTNKILDKDRHVFSSIDLHAGDDYKVVEISYTRKK